MAWFSLSAVGLIFGYAVFRSGAGLPEDWYPSSAALGIVGLVYWLGTPRRNLAPAPTKVLCSLLGAIFAITCLQVIPLPLAVVGSISPHRVELQQALQPITGPVETATLSVAPARSFRYLLIFVGCMVAFFLAREMTWRFRGRLWLVIAPWVIVAFLEALLGLVQVYGAGNDLAQGTYVNRNHYAGLLEMALPFTVMNAVAAWSRRRTWETDAGPALRACIWLTIGAVLLAAIVHSLSRMGFVAALAGLLIVGVCWFATGSVTNTRAVLIGAVALFVVLGFLFLPTDPLILRFADLASTEEISADTRAQIWRDSWQLVATYPLLGTGIGGYESGFLEYKTVAPLHLVDFAHNDYLQLLAELGVVGFALLVLLAGRTFAQVSWMSSASTDIDERCLGIATAGSLGALALHSFVDFNLYVPAHSMMVASIAGLVDQLAFAAHKRESPGQATERDRIVESEPKDSLRAMFGRSSLTA